MATPVGHGIVGYTLARAAGVRSTRGVALSVGAACLPDVDFIAGYVSNGDPMSLHHELITHKPVFPLLVGAATGVAMIAGALLRGRLPRPGAVLKPAALATALVATHVMMDPLPLPYDPAATRAGTRGEAMLGRAWNIVIDLALYGTIAVLALERRGGRKRAAED
jgi:hypothetical protein